MNDISHMSEDEIIALFNVFQSKPPVIKGIGDDCAVLGPFGEDVLVWTSDLLTEDVHFTLESISPTDLGYKSMAVNLSDIAAMGANPVAALLSIALPPETSAEWLKSFRDGIVEVAEQYSCPIAGGDTTASNGPVTISVSVIGRAKEKEVLLRSGAGPGQDIWISGIPGLSATGFELISRGIEPASDDQHAAVKRHFRPAPKNELGYILGTQQLAAAAIDTSDGISQDLRRVCRASGIGAVLDEKSIPLPPEIEAIEMSPLEAALHGGEDYQLLFTALPENRGKIAALGDVTRIGETTAGQTGIKLKRTDGTLEEVKRGGFQHFREDETDQP